MDSRAQLETAIYFLNQSEETKTPEPFVYLLEKMYSTHELKKIITEKSGS